MRTSLWPNEYAGSFFAINIAQPKAADVCRPAKVRRQLPSLCEGGFADRGQNVLLFGLPGRGKTHVASAIGHELVLRGRPVLFTAMRASETDEVKQKLAADPYRRPHAMEAGLELEASNGADGESDRYRDAPGDEGPR